MIKSRLRLADAEAIAGHFKVARGSVYRWASEDKWTKYGTSSRRLWNLGEAQASYTKRHPDIDDDVSGAAAT